MLLKLEGHGPLYTQVYTTLRRHIIDGGFRPGERLPGTRSVARALGVSRTVVLLAYSQLESEGYTRTRVGSGTFVAERPAPEGAAHAVAAAEPVIGEPACAADDAPPPAEVPLSRVAARVTHVAAPDHPLDLLDTDIGVIDLTDAAVSYDERALKFWRRSLSQTMAELPGQIPSQSGLLALREVMLEYLNRERGIVANVEDLIIVNSAQQARDLIARVLVDEHTVVGVEEPCDPGVRSAFAAAGGHLAACSPDAGGLDITRYTDALAAARVVHVSPACHLPTGAVMSAERRAALLAWAYAQPAYVIEEDFDCEDRHGVRVLPSLQAEDRHERVIYYMNRFARAVYPALQVGCVVVPPPLREKFHALKDLSDRDGVALRQHAWARYVAEGEYARSLRRLAHRLSGRYQAITQAIERHFGHAARIEGRAAAGMLLVHLPMLGADWLTMLLEEALRLGVLLQSAADWYLKPPRHATVLLHYAAVSDALLDTAIERLARAYQRTVDDVGLRPAARNG
jgi:GntR family transcriptional regulator/MocR family aminotransferase